MNRAVVVDGSIIRHIRPNGKRNRLRLRTALMGENQMVMERCLLWLSRVELRLVVRFPDGSLLFLRPAIGRMRGD